MAFDASEFLAQFEAGEPAHVSEFDLTAMEDTLINRYLPLYTGRSPATTERFQLDWNHRLRLVDEIRGSDFLGRLLDPVIEPLDDPFEAMVAAYPAAKRRPEPDNVIGLQLTTPIKSTRHDMQGSICRSVWYTRRPESRALSQFTSFWQRVVGENTAENNIDAIMDRSRRAIPYARR